MTTTTATFNLADLSRFCGTENWHRHWSGILFTDGIKFLADNAGAHWLIDLVASYQIKPKVKVESFQLWTLTKKFHGAVATMQRDKGCQNIVRQEVEYTDFPFGGQNEFSFYVCDGVMLLKSEY